jgi:hypothetical protein
MSPWPATYGPKALLITLLTLPACGTIGAVVLAARLLGWQ